MWRFNLKGNMMAEKPKAMVLVFKPELTHSVWQDFFSNHRTIRGLERALKKGVNDGVWVGWRIIDIQKEVLGNA